MASDTFAVTREVKGCPVLPISSKHGCDSTTIALRPPVKRQNRIACLVPRPGRGGYLRITSAVKSQRVPPAISLSHFYNDKRTRYSGMPPLHLHVYAADN